MSFMEDRLEFTRETMKNIELSKQDIREGRTISIENLRKKIRHRKNIYD